MLLKTICIQSSIFVGTKQIYYLGEIDENKFNSQNEFNTYTIKVKYNLKTARYTKVDNDIKLMKIYVEEHPRINMPWGKMRL